MNKLNNKIVKGKKRTSVGGKSPKRSTSKYKGKKVSYSSPFKHFTSRLFWGMIAMMLVVIGYFLFKLVTDNPFHISPRYGFIKYPKGDIRGIDVSHYQKDIDWDKLKNAQINGVPIQFIFVKATEGSTIMDENFNQNFYNARKAGLIRGAYHFFSTQSPPLEQARWFSKMVWLDKYDLPPVLDVEQSGGLSPKHLQAMVLQWMDYVEHRYGVTPILYTSYKFKQTYLNTPEFDKYPYWIAHYYVDKLQYKGKWAFWQHTDRGHVNGIDGEVDVNVFNGNYDQLVKMTIGGESVIYLN